MRVWVQTRRVRAVLMAMVVVMACATGSDAAERRFVFVYEATTQPLGEFEYEQWVTWQADKDSDPHFNRIEFRHELEFALTDTLQLGLYLSDWRVQWGDSVGDGAQWRDAAVEVIYGLSDPVTDPLGLALYGEIKIGDELFELETKLLVQKNIGKWVFAWNGTLEAEWEGPHYDEDKGVLEQAFGASYQFSPELLAGFELVHEVEYEDWSHWGDHVLYAGPNFSYRRAGWWLTAAPLFQVTDVAGEPNFMVRFILGIHF